MMVTLLLKVGKISLRFGKSNWIIYSKFLSILTGLWQKKKKKTNKETRETEYYFSTWKECGLWSPHRHKSLGECMLLSHLISWHFSFFVCKMEMMPPSQHCCEDYSMMGEHTVYTQYTDAVSVRRTSFCSWCGRWSRTGPGYLWWPCRKTLSSMERSWS